MPINGHVFSSISNIIFLTILPVSSYCIFLIKINKPLGDCILSVSNLFFPFCPNVLLAAFAATTIQKLLLQYHQCAKFEVNFSVHTTIYFSASFVSVLQSLCLDMLLVGFQNSMLSNVLSSISLVRQYC